METPETNFRQYVSIPKAARLLGMSPTWLREKVDKGLIPSVRPGWHRRVLLADLLAYRDSRMEHGAPRIKVLANNPLDD